MGQFGSSIPEPPCCYSRDVDGTGATPRYPGPKELRRRGTAPIRSPKHPRPPTIPERTVAEKVVHEGQEADQWLESWDDELDLADADTVDTGNFSPTTTTAPGDEGEESLEQQQKSDGQAHPKSQVVPAPTLGEIMDWNCDDTDGPGPHPSIGSRFHYEGTCKRCCFAPKGRCTSGYDCQFCHYEHGKRIRKRKSRTQQTEALEDTGFKALEEAGFIPVLPLADLPDPASGSNSPGAASLMPDTPDTVRGIAGNRGSHHQLARYPQQLTIGFGPIGPSEPARVQVGTNMETPYASSSWRSGWTCPANSDHSALPPANSSGYQSSYVQDGRTYQTADPLSPLSIAPPTFGLPQSVQSFDASAMTFGHDQAWSQQQHNQQQQQPQQQQQQHQFQPPPLPLPPLPPQPQGTWPDPHSVAIAAATAAAAEAAARQQHMQNHVQQQQLLQQQDMQMQQARVQQFHQQDMQAKQLPQLPPAAATYLRGRQRGAPRCRVE